MISIQSPKHLHPDVHNEAITDKESQPLLHVSSEEAEGKEVDNTAADRSKATLMEEEGTAISLGSIAEQDGEAMLSEILQLEAAEEDATQEMTASQKRVTFQLPGKTFAGSRLALVNDPFCRKKIPSYLSPSYVLAHGSTQAIFHTSCCLSLSAKRLPCQAAHHRKAHHPMFSISLKS